MAAIIAGADFVDWLESGPRGDRRSARIPVCTMADGGRLTLPVHVVVGSQSGPLVVFLACQHGNEILPVLGLRRIWDDLNAEEMSGTVVIVPVANPMAFEHGSRGAPMDGLWADNGNMNRVWPGKADGWLSERLADILFTQILRAADCTVDMHSGYAALAIYYAYLLDTDDEAGLRQAALARAFGLELYMRENRRRGTLSDLMLSEGNTFLAVEIGDFYGRCGGRWMDAEARYPRNAAEVTATGALNVLRHLGVIPGDVVLPRFQALVSPEVALRPSRAGLLIPLVGAGDIGRVVPEGTPLATVLDPWSFQVVETLTAPFSQSIVVATTQSHVKVNPGDYGVWVADWQQATIQETWREVKGDH